MNSDPNICVCINEYSHLMLLCFFVFSSFSRPVNGLKPGALTAITVAPAASSQGLVPLTV